jgi:hypothetical protein
LQSTETDKLREMAEERADQAISQFEREAWLQAARDWTELAENGEKRNGKR